MEKNILGDKNLYSEAQSRRLDGFYQRLTITGKSDSVRLCIFNVFEALSIKIRGGILV